LTKAINGKSQNARPELLCPTHDAIQPILPVRILFITLVYWFNELVFNTHRLGTIAPVMFIAMGYIGLHSTRQVYLPSCEEKPYPVNKIHLNQLHENFSNVFSSPSSIPTMETATAFPMRLGTNQMTSSSAIAKTE
jgi:hypothetical protein